MKLREMMTRHLESYLSVLESDEQLLHHWAEQNAVELKGATASARSIFLNVARGKKLQVAFRMKVSVQKDAKGSKGAISDLWVYYIREFFGVNFITLAEARTAHAHEYDSKVVPATLIKERLVEETKKLTALIKTLDKTDKTQEKEDKEETLKEKEEDLKIASEGAVNFMFYLLIA